jgi:hypothetical protein
MRTESDQIVFTLGNATKITHPIFKAVFIVENLMDKQKEGSRKLKTTLIRTSELPNHERS